jgi:Txe/YoeB family toxin of Txe-Axe toxin-antitoxin module
MRRIAFLPEAFEHFNLWLRENKKIHTRIIELIKDIGASRFQESASPNL